MQVEMRNYAGLHKANPIMSLRFSNLHMVIHVLRLLKILTETNFY
jgi:hypothetical protein